MQNTMFEAGFAYILSKSLMNTPTIKTKSGNTRCSLAFFFVLYGFFMLRKMTRIEKVTVHPITFTAANRRRIGREKTSLWFYRSFHQSFIAHFICNMSDKMVIWIIHFKYKNEFRCKFILNAPEMHLRKVLIYLSFSQIQVQKCKNF